MGERELWWQAYLAAVTGLCAFGATRDDSFEVPSISAFARAQADKAIADYAERFPTPPAAGGEK